MTLEIRRATIEDVEEIARLYVVLSDHQQPIDPSNTRYRLAPEVWRRQAATILTDPERGTFVALSDGSAVGFVSCSFAAKPWGRSCEINTLVVDEASRGREIGTRLMETIERFGIEQGAAGLRVDVLTGNAAARRFYERLGYHEIAVRYAKKVPDDSP
jgi:ribosomal protein S18 acetylase RimI-like enzyme